MNDSTVNTNLTPAAEKFIHRMLRFGTGAEAGFRLKVSPGGCSGLAAEFDLAAGPGPSDLLWELSGLRIFLDAKSRLLLDGATVDFAESHLQAGFVITVPGKNFAACSPAAPLVSIQTLLRNA